MSQIIPVNKITPTNSPILQYYIAEIKKQPQSLTIETATDDTEIENITNNGDPAHINSNSDNDNDNDNEINKKHPLAEVNSQQSSRTSSSSRATQPPLTSNNSAYTKPPKITIHAHQNAPIPDTYNPPVRRASLLKQNSSYLTPSGLHLSPLAIPKRGRRLSFSDETGEKLVETAFSDKLHYSQNTGVLYEKDVGYTQGGRQMDGERTYEGRNGGCVCSIM